MSGKTYNFVAMLTNFIRNIKQHMLNIKAKYVKKKIFILSPNTIHMVWKHGAVSVAWSLTFTCIVFHYYFLYFDTLFLRDTQESNIDVYLRYKISFFELHWDMNMQLVTWSNPITPEENVIEMDNVSNLTFSLPGFLKISLNV